MAQNDGRPATTITAEDLAAALQQGIQQGMAQALAAVAPPKPFDYQEYLNRPENRDPAEQLRRPVFQHGQPVNLRGCSKDTIEHLNKIEPGEYISGRVRVTVRGKAPYEQVHINYPMATVQERMHNHTLFTSFSDLVQKIAREQRTT